MKKLRGPIGLRLSGLLTATLLFAAPAAAAPITIDFENASILKQPIPNGYAGVDWENFSSQSDFFGGYHTGIVSGSWTGYNMFGDPAVISKSTGFNLYDGYFTGAWRDDLQLTARAYRNGASAYSQTVHINTTGPQLVTFNFLNVDYVLFETFGGVNAGIGADGLNFVVDDLRIDLVTTPLPAALPLFATALGGLVFAARRRKRDASA